MRAAVPAADRSERRPPIIVGAPLSGPLAFGYRYAIGMRHALTVP